MAMNVTRKSIFFIRVKTAFYPDIPEPKLPADWPRTQVQYKFNPRKPTQANSNSISATNN